MDEEKVTRILSDENINKKFLELVKKIKLEDDENESYLNEMKHLLRMLCIKYKTIKFGEFVLKSKINSSFFFSSGTLNNIVSTNIISFLIADLILKKKIDFDYIFGASYKGIPIATLTSSYLLSSNKYHNIFYLYDRKEAKSYGEKSDVVGLLEDDTNKQKKLIIIDDVFTSGVAITEILNKLKIYNNIKVVAIIILFNRNEYKVNEKNEICYMKDLFVQKFNIPIYSILNYTDDFKYLIKP